jgi:glycine C-acetyltransferase
MRKGEAAKIVLDFKGASSTNHESGVRSEAANRSGCAQEGRHLQASAPSDDADGAEVHMEEAGDVIVLSSNNYLGSPIFPKSSRRESAGSTNTARERHRCASSAERSRSTASSRSGSRSFSARRRRSRTSLAGTRIPGLFATICDAGSAIISDELNHASIIDGVRLASKAKRERYKHSDMADLEEKLQSVADNCFPIVVVTDGVFSMEGRSRQAARDRRALQEVRRRQRRRRFARHRRHGQDRPRDDRALSALTGKSTSLRDPRQGARRRSGRFRRRQLRAGRYAHPAFAPAVFSNALPATVACSSLAAIEYLDAHPELVDRCATTRILPRRGSSAIGYKPLDGESAIVPIIVGETALCHRDERQAAESAASS